ncbi:MAG: hypothetical protein AAF640_06730 [Pseudomonadota bacterium]
MKQSLLMGLALGVVLAFAALLFAPQREGPVRAEPRDVALSCYAQSANSRMAVSVTGVDVDVPEALHARLDLASQLLNARWQDWLGVDELTPAPASLQFLGDAARFHSVYDGPNVEGSTATGFYRIRSHEAFVLFDEAHRRSAAATALHELSHLHTAWHLGPTPPWLNEGLAEYFETLRPGPPPAFVRSRSHLELLLSQGPVPLTELLRLPRREFAREYAQRRYASAWSLTTFLLEHRAGREVFRALLRDAHARRCESGAELRIDALLAYPGGLESLEQAWERWISRHVVRRRG